MKILGVRIDNLSKQEIIQKIESFLNENKFHQIATVNPEFILRAQKDLEFKNILNKTDLNVVDGVGIWYALFRHGEHLKNRIAGIDLMHEILQIADRKQLSLFLAIHRNGLSSFEEIRGVLGEKFPNIKICGQDVDPRKSKEQLCVINEDLVFCNFGFPMQEKFINLLKNKQKTSLQLDGYRGKIKLAMGVGGAFDFVTGKKKRAPIFMQKLGFEWLWRFLLEPKYRAKRIFRAIIIFPIKVLFSS